MWVEGASQINKMEDKAGSVLSATQDAVAKTSQSYVEIHFSQSEKYTFHN